MDQNIRKNCPECQVELPPETTACPYCGIQLTHPPWKRLGAWIMLILICYGLVRCHVRLLDGFQEF